jgi:hypothetical protein
MRLVGIAYSSSMKGNLLSGKTYVLPNIAIYRYRTIPSFSRVTFRKITNNPSALKKLAARDYEDLLQVSYTIIVVLLRNIYA